MDLWFVGWVGRAQKGIDPCLLKGGVWGVRWLNETSRLAAPKICCHACRPVVMIYSMKVFCHVEIP